jgi:hypothetical protein
MFLKKKTLSDHSSATSSEHSYANLSKQTGEQQTNETVLPSLQTINKQESLMRLIRPHSKLSFSKRISSSEKSSKKVNILTFYPSRILTLGLSDQFFKKLSQEQGLKQNVAALLYATLLVQDEKIRERQLQIILRNCSTLLFNKVEEFDAEISLLKEYDKIKIIKFISKKFEIFSLHEHHKISSLLKSLSYADEQLTPYEFILYAYIRIQFQRTRNIEYREFEHERKVPASHSYRGDKEIDMMSDVLYECRILFSTLAHYTNKCSFIQKNSGKKSFNSQQKKIKLTSYQRASSNIGLADEILQIEYCTLDRFFWSLKRISSCKSVLKYNILKSCLKLFRSDSYLDKEEKQLYNLIKFVLIH